MRLKLTRLAAVMALVMPASSMALGLGKIEMRSALDQRLNAEIELESVRPGDLDDLKIMLASPDLFRQHRVDRLDFLNEITFEVVRRPNGTPFVRLGSTKPIREPFLNFLVEASWSSGRMVRQYTVLVDPPTLLQQAPAPVQAPRVATPQPVTRTEPVPVRQAAPAPAPVAAPAVAAKPGGAQEYGRTQRNDTLWTIASQMRPTDSVTTHQVMLALLRNNPDAFYNNNVNNLKAGYVLRIDTPDQVAAVSAAEAEREIRRQNREWKAWKSGAPFTETASAEVASAAAGTAVPGTSAAEVREQARLKLASAKGEGKAPGLSAEGSQNVTELQQALALANESMEANRQETEDLRSRLLALEEQIQSLQKLVQLKDSELASMQNRPEAKPQVPAQGEAKPQPQQAKAQPKPAVQPESESILDNPVVLGISGIIAVLLGWLGWMFVRRRKATEYQESILSQSATASQATEFAVDQVPSETISTRVDTSVQEKEPEESSLLTDFTSTAMEGLQTEVGEIDPMSEADVYLAYGRYNQAEEIIARAIENDPGRDEYRLKMLEIQFAAKSPERFVEQARALRDSLGGTSSPLWAKALSMGRELCPEDALFQGGDEVTASTSEVDAGDDLLSDIGDFDAADIFGDEDKPQQKSGLAFDSRSAGAAKDEAKVTAKSRDDNSLDFDSSSFAALSSSSVVEEPEVDVSGNTLDFEGGLYASAETGEGHKLGEEEVVDLSEEVLEEKPLADDAFGFDSLEPDERQDDESLRDIEADLSEMADKLDDESRERSARTADEGMEISALDEDASLGDYLNDNPFADVDEVGTKLDLARAYIDMGDKEGAQGILDEIMQEGNEDQRKQAQTLQAQL